MPIPDYQSLMLPILQVIRDQQETPLARLREQMAEQLRLSNEDLAERLASGSQTVFSNRIAWAVQFLKEASAVQAVRRGVYTITDRGLLLLRNSSSGITVKTLRQFPEFLEFQGDRPADPAALTVSASQPEAKETPEEALERNSKLLHDALANDLLETVRNGTPAAFEQLVVDLLLAMGYGGSDEDAGKVVGRSGDGGVDGIIKQDRLGLDAVYVQAKRWKDVVGSPELMKFSGGLTGKRASKGVFITTSGFTRDASEYAERLSQKIVLIDGRELASLMIKYNVGVTRAQKYELKRLDQGYFDSL
jgi:restriction system protein